MSESVAVLVPLSLSAPLSESMRYTLHVNGANEALATYK
jgi:hypothetical protein